MSHDQLFRHASVVVHHGGAGTTASVLHAGKPHVVVPHIADQNFFAHEVRRLGCGVRIARASWPERLSSAVGRVTADSRFAARAAAARDTLKRENGIANAVAAIEGFVTRRDRLPIGDAI
jgi:vancomycin aglycone glucosyltransferase